MAVLVLSSGFDPLQIILHSGLVAKVTLLLLLGMSVLSWALFLTRRGALVRVLGESRRSREAFLRAADPAALAAEARALSEGPVKRMFLAAHAEYQDLARAWAAGGVAPDMTRAEAGRQLLSRTLASARTQEMLLARSGAGILATVGATAPFIGLFGTVWGIVDSFAAIGAQKSADLSVVAPGIAEALIATAVGLVAAVPAVWFFNALGTATRKLGAELDAFTAEFLNAYDRAIAAPERGD